MDDLIAFLGARLDEREAALQRLATTKHDEALSRLEISVHTEMSVLADIGTWPRSMPPYEADAWRMLLADVAAKRQIIELFVEIVNENSSSDYLEQHGWELRLDSFLAALRLLGLPFASHPDYREEWRV